MKRYICILIAMSSNLTACGDIIVKKPDDKEVEIGKGDPKEENDGKPAANEFPNGDSSNTSIVSSQKETLVDVSVNVKVSNQETTDQQSGNLTYVPKAVSWSEAMESCPEYFRLVTRAEAIALYDAGALRELGIKGIVWTASRAPMGESMAWFVDTDSGLSSGADDRTAFSYICARKIQ
jgi:hypothetical protein